jgi:hypothetical protein
MTSPRFARIRSVSKRPPNPSRDPPVRGSQLGHTLVPTSITHSTLNGGLLSEVHGAAIALGLSFLLRLKHFVPCDLPAVDQPRVHLHRVNHSVLLTLGHPTASALHPYVHASPDRFALATTWPLSTLGEDTRNAILEIPQHQRRLFVKEAAGALELSFAGARSGELVCQFRAGPDA